MDFFTSGLFWFVMGILFVGVALGFWAWTREWGLVMKWWKWLLALLWWVLLNITIASPFTLLAEDEGTGALGVFGILAVITIILGVGLWRLLIRGRTVPEPATA